MRLSQAGELCHAIEAGRVKDDHLKGEIGEVLAGTVPGRSNREQITLYKSLGHVAQDISRGQCRAQPRRRNLIRSSTLDW